MNERDDQLRTIVLDMLEEIRHFGDARNYEARLRRIGWIEGDKPPAVTKMMYIALGADPIKVVECDVGEYLATELGVWKQHVIGESAFFTRDDAAARRVDLIGGLIEVRRSEIERLEAMKS